IVGTKILCLTVFSGCSGGIFMRMRVTAALAATVVVLVGCDNGGSAVETRERGAAEPVGLSATAASAEADVSPPEPAKPTVTANRRETADAKVQRLYE